MLDSVSRGAALLTQVTAFGVVNSNGQTGDIPTGMNFAFGGGQTPVNGPVSPESQLPSQAGGKASKLGLESSKNGGSPGSDQGPKVTPRNLLLLLLIEPGLPPFWLD